MDPSRDTHERLGPLDDVVAAARAELDERDAVRRLWARDHTLWQDDPTEVANRLGWLDGPAAMRAALDDLRGFAADAVADGFTHAVVLGMGGSSLFPEVLARTFGPAPGATGAPGALDLRVLDTTDPAAIGRLTEQLPLEHTLFVASSKSGTTTETLSHLAFFWEKVARAEQFVVVTDPGSPLEKLAGDRGFRRVFANDPDIGGRYSALSYFGMVPGALLGVDLAALLARARESSDACGPGARANANPGARLGAAMGAAARAGRDKLTLVLPDEVSTFALWLEQLIAESTGKHGTGILPVAGEPLGPPDVYGDDRLFVALGPAPDALGQLADRDHPVVELPYDDRDAIGREVFRWEVATALAGAVLGINPFDQPNVAEAKAATARVLDEGLPDVPVEPIGGLLGQVRPGDYLALQAYVDPGDHALVAALERARVALRNRYRVATTLGLGPRFLHSTGQLHKGGPPTGVFVQVVGDDRDDLPIPDRTYGFSTLKRAQAAGDLQTLQAHRLRAARVALDELLEVAG